MSFNQILGILLRRGWIAVLTALSALAVALAVLQYVPGSYDAVATASIDPTVDPITGARRPPNFCRATCLSS